MAGAAWAFVDQLEPDETAQRIDGRAWRVLGFSNRLRCEKCQRDYPLPDPRLFSFNSPLGACPQCEGFGNLVDIDMDLVVPDPNKTLREGAIAPWNTPAYAHELEELLALAPERGLPVDIPFRELTAEHRQLIREGVPERKFGGLRGFFAWLDKRKYKMHLRVFASRWRSYHACPACGGSRLRPEALCARIGGQNIAEMSRAKIADTLRFLRSLPWTDWERRVGRVMLDQILDRLGFLERVGVGYLTLERTLRTLSGGEAQRVSLTSALGSSLVNMLYVLDEPSVGLHPCDVHRLTGALEALRDRGNTVILVEHEEELLRACDHIVELGPGAGERGGEIVFQGSLAELLAAERSLTGEFLTGRRGVAIPERRRAPSHGWIRLVGARGNNLQQVTVEFPLGVFCLVTGVSGAGKSTLVQDTLYPALCRRKRKEGPKPAPFDDVYGDGQIEDVLLVDQSPMGRSSRSNPVTYVKAFDEIRAVFAETVEARTRNYSASHFSFNVDGGRCTACQGEGHVEIDMQFLADVYMKCDQCQGRRYRKEILDVTYRGRNIADVLEHDGAGGVLLFSRPDQGPGETETPDRRRPGLPPAGAAGEHVVGGRGAASEAGRLCFVRSPAPHAVPDGRADHGTALCRHRAIAGLLRCAARGRPLADYRRTQSADDESVRLHYRSGPGRGRRGRAGRGAGDPREGRSLQGIGHRATPGRLPRRTVARTGWIVAVRSANRTHIRCSLREQNA